MSDTTSIDEILKRDELGRFAKRDPELAAEPPAEPEQPAPEAPKPEAQAPEQPAAVTPPPSPTGVVPSPEPKPGPSPVPPELQAELAGLKAELARLRARNREMTAPAAQPQPAKPPSVFEDEEGYTRHITQNVDEMVFDRVLALSEYSAKERFQDFNQVMGTEGDGPEAVHTKWVGLVQRNPALFDQFKRHPNPVVFAYQTLKKQALLDEIGEDPAAYRERIRKEMEAEFATKAATPQAQQAARPEPVIPATLAGKPSQASRSAPEWSGPKPIEEIIKPRW